MSEAARTATNTADKGETSAPRKEKTAGQLAHASIPWDKVTIEAAPSAEKKVPYAKILNPENGNKLVGQVMIPTALKKAAGAAEGEGVPAPFVTIKGAIAFDKEIQDDVKKAGGKAIMEPVLKDGQPVVENGKDVKKFAGLKFDLDKGADVVTALEGAKSPKAKVLIKALKAAKGVYDEQHKAVAKF